MYETGFPFSKEGYHNIFSKVGSIPSRLHVILSGQDPLRSLSCQCPCERKNRYNYLCFVLDQSDSAYATE